MEGDIGWSDIKETLQERVQTYSGLEDAVIGRGEDFDAAQTDARQQLPAENLNDPRYDAISTYELEDVEVAGDTVVSIAYTERSDADIPEPRGKGSDATSTGRRDGVSL
jgi:hypothetical protein